MTEHGASLLELVAALALAAILGAFAVVRLAEVVGETRVAGAARTIATQLRLARGCALAGGGVIDVRCDRARRSCDVRDAAGTRLETRTLPAGVAFTALPARQGVSFTALGTADNGTFTVGAGAHRRSVVVNQRGRVRVS